MLQFYFEDVVEDDNIPSTSSPSFLNSSIYELAVSPSAPAPVKRSKDAYQHFIDNIERTSTMIKEEMSSLKEIQNKMVDLTEKAILVKEKRNEILEEMSNNIKNFYKDLINLLRE